MLDRLSALQFLLLPLLLFGALIYSLPQLPLFQSPWEELLPSLPYLLGALIVLLGWHFNSGRSVLAALLLLLASFSLQAPVDPLYAQTCLILLPLNLALVAWYPERGLLSPVALLRLAWICIQVAALIILIERYPHTLQIALTYQPPFFAQFAPAIEGWVPVSFISLCALFLSALLLLGRMLQQRGRFDAYLLVSAIVGCSLILGSFSERGHSLLLALMLALWLFGLFRHSHNLAYLDDLTGLPGRRALNEHMMRLGRQYCLAMLDVDHFKKFNDTYGHDVGDQVLKLVASKLAQVRLGKAYRYGGEEFCVVFAGRELEECLAPLEELRSMIEHAHLKLRNPKRPKSNRKGRKQRGHGSDRSDTVSVTISIGVAEHQPKQNTLKQADKALYRAKAGGRNKVCS